MATDGPATRQERIEARFRERYREFQYVFVEFFADHVADLSRTFKGDLTEMLVLALIGQMMLRRLIAEGKARPGESVAAPLITASRLADVSGIPRQTVRRKLLSLEARGWIERVDERGWSLRMVEGQSVARLALADVNDRGLKRIAGLFRDLEKLVEPETGR